jgi:hypothetical protein
MAGSMCRRSTLDRRFKQIELEDAHQAMTDYSRPRDLRLARFAPLVPDATVTLHSDAFDGELDLLIELDRTRRPTKNIDKLHRYDAFLTAWWRLTERYGHMRQPPVVIFVCPDEDQVISLMQAADREVTGRHARPGTASETWSSPGRERMLFVAELDAHDFLSRAWALPKQAFRERDSEDFWARETELPAFL